MTLDIYLHIHWWHFLTCLCEFSFTYRLLICIFQEFHSLAKNTPDQKYSYCRQPCKKSLSVTVSHCFVFSNKKNSDITQK